MSKLYNKWKERGAKRGYIVLLSQQMNCTTNKLRLLY